MKKWIIIGAGVLLALSVTWLIRNSRAVTKSAPYHTVRTEGEIEIRDYPELTLASTAMEDARGSGAFGRLFQYITGKNARQEEIPMTTPVLIDPATGKQTMSFVLPEELAKKGAPEPGNDVQLRKMEPARYAVLRFKGDSSVENQLAAAEKLRAWLKERNITAQSEPIFAYYDPPWTPIFLRRNEVMVKIVSTG